MNTDRLRQLREQLPSETLLNELTPETWFACEHPERPPDGQRTGYHEGCYPCAIAAMARAKRDPSPLNRRMAEYMLATVEE